MDSLKPKICLYCNNEFIPKVIEQKFCNRDCSKRYRKKKILKKCSKCGELMISTPRKKFCNNCSGKSETQKATRFWLFARDEFKCIYCGRSSIEDGVKLVPEHVFPRWDGGQNTFYNLVTACERCNKEKFGFLLSKKLILRIWNRNKKLGVKSPYKYVDEIIKEFEVIYPTTTIDLKRYFNFMN